MASNSARNSRSASGPAAGTPAVTATLRGVAGFERLASAVDGLRAGVMELEQSPSYLMLVDAGPTSRTRAEFGSAVLQAGDLWALLHALGARVEEARRHIDQHGLADRPPGRNDKPQRELDLLLGSPIEVILDGTRGPGGSSLSIEAALKRLRERYDALQQGVTRIDQVWLNVLPRVEAARETVVRLQAEADALGVVEPLVGRARARADDLGERLVADPVSVTVEDGPALDRLVADAARQMAKLRAGRDNLDDDLAATEEVLAGLRVLRTRAEAAAVETRQKIVDPEGLVAVPTSAVIDGPGGLAEQLDAIFELARSGGESDRPGGAASWARQRSVLDRWLATAARLQTQLTEAVRRNQVGLDRRDELRGRLQAFQAKMAATGRSEEARAMELADTAWTELYTAPTDVDEAEAAIVELATVLRKPRS